MHTPALPMRRRLRNAARGFLRAALHFMFMQAFSYSFNSTLRQTQHCDPRHSHAEANRPITEASRGAACLAG